MAPFLFPNTIAAINSIVFPRWTSPPVEASGNLIFINLVAINTNAINSDVSAKSLVVNLFFLYEVMSLAIVELLGISINSLLSHAGIRWHMIPVFIK